MAKAKPAKFTQQDTTTIIALGYKLKGVSLDDFAKFMQRELPGCDLALLLTQVEQLMVPHAITVVSRVITVSGDTLRVRLENVFRGEDDALIFDRLFYKEAGKLKVKHEYLVFPVHARNNGYSKKVLAASLVQYKKMDISSIEIFAGLSAGGFVWAHANFVAVDPADVGRILRFARRKLTNSEYLFVERIFDDYYDVNPCGNAFPIRRWADLPFMEDVLKKSQWQGRLDLSDPTILRKFEKYVRPKKT